MTTPARVGIVGAGAIVTTIHLPVLASRRDARVTWIADASGVAAAEAATAFGIAQSLATTNPADLPECDAVLLATPVYARRAYLAEFARRGTPVLAEKPFALSAAEHSAWLADCGDLPVACGYMRRGYTTTQALRLLVSEGWLGQLQGASYAEGGRVARTGGSAGTLDRPYTEGGGVLRDLGCHGVDTLAYITGAQGVDDVTATVRWDGRTDRDVRARYRLHYEGPAGIPGSCPVDFAVSWLSDTANELVLEFPAARVRCGLGPADRLLIESRDGQRALPCRIELAGATTSYQAFHLEWSEFLAMRSGGSKGSYAAASSLLTTRIVDAIYAAGDPP